MCFATLQSTCQFFGIHFATRAHAHAHAHAYAGDTIMMKHFYMLIEASTLFPEETLEELGEFVLGELGPNKTFETGVIELGLDPTKNLIGDGTLEIRFRRGISAYRAKLKKHQITNNATAVEKRRVISRRNEMRLEMFNTNGTPYTLGRFAHARERAAVLQELNKHKKG